MRAYTVKIPFRSRLGDIIETRLVIPYQGAREWVADEADDFRRYTGRGASAQDAIAALQRAYDDESGPKGARPDLEACPRGPNCPKCNGDE